MSSFTVKVIPRLSDALGVKYTDQIFLLMGISRLAITVLTSIFLNKFNQKQLLIFSSIGMVVTGLPISILTHFTPVHDDLRPADWLLMSFFLTYVLVSSIGILGIPWTIIFELLPTNARGLVGPLVVGFGYTMMALHLQFFLDIIDHGHVATVFLFYSILAVVGTVYIKKCLPETRGKSLYEIETFFNKKEEKEAGKDTTVKTTEKV